MGDLDRLLFELNTWLDESDIKIEISVIGAYAIQLHGINSRATIDVDTLNEIENPLVLQKIEEIGEKYGVDSWFNNQPKGLIIPTDFHNRVLSTKKFSHIHIQYAS